MISLNGLHILYGSIDEEIKMSNINIRKKNVIAGPDVPNGKMTFKSINAAKKYSRELQAKDCIVRKSIQEK